MPRYKPYSIDTGAFVEFVGARDNIENLSHYKLITKIVNFVTKDIFYLMALKNVS